MPATGKAQAAYEYGDTVFAHADDGPRLMRVLASGADGFVGEDETGNRHEVPHDRYLGHHKRSKHAYKVVTEGEDGCIVEDETGQRRFIAGKAPTTGPDGKPPRDNAHRFSHLHTEDLKLRPMGTLAKALAPFPDGVLLLLKAVPAKPQRAAKPKPKPKRKTADRPQKPLHKHGDLVAFRHGDVEGTGKIVGSGLDGVTVIDDATGREHLVRHDALLPHHPKPAEAKTDDAKDESASSDGPDHA